MGLHALVCCGLNDRFTVQAETPYIVTVHNPLLRWGESLAGCLAGPYFVRSRAAATVARGWLPGSILGSGMGSIQARCVLVCACLVAVAACVWAPAYTGPHAAGRLLGVSTQDRGFILRFTGLTLAIAGGKTWFSAALEHPVAGAAGRGR